MLLICLVTSLPASAGSREAPELLDVAGDARVAGLPGGSAASGVDIVRGWFSSVGTATRVHLETVGSARGPNMVLVLTFDVDDIAVFVGYGQVLMPSGIAESFYACASRAGEHGDSECREVDGEARPDGTGFGVDVPVEWLPPGATASNLRARTYVLPPPVGPAATMDEAGPPFDEAGPGAPYRAPEEASPVQVALAAAGDAREVPGAHASVGLLATLAAALLLARRA